MGLHGRRCTVENADSVLEVGRGKWMAQQGMHTGCIVGLIHTHIDTETVLEVERGKWMGKEVVLG